MPRPLRVAVARPLWARNHTAFERQADVYAYIAQHYPVEVHVLADRRFRFADDRLAVEYVRAADALPLVPRVLRRLRCPTDHYVGLRDLAGYDVIETEDPSVFWWARYAAIGARRSGARLVLWASENRTEVLGTPHRLLRRNAREVAPEAAALLVPTDLQAARYAALGFGQIPVFSDMYGIDTDRFAPDPSRRTPGLVLAVGKLIPQKGHDILIRAFARAAADVPDARLRIVGSGDPAYRQQLLRLAAAEGVASRVELTGAVPAHDMPAVYQEASIFALHSLSERHVDEKFGAVYLEAMASGLPTIGSRCGGIPCVIGEAGLLVPQRDVTALAAALRSLLVDSVRRATLAWAARQRAIARYDLPVVADKWYRAWGGHAAR